jgi:hypothetical protein
MSITQEPLTVSGTPFQFIGRLKAAISLFECLLWASPTGSSPDTVATDLDGRGAQ